MPSRCRAAEEDRARHRLRRRRARAAQADGERRVGARERRREDGRGGRTRSMDQRAMTGGAGVVEGVDGS